MSNTYDAALIKSLPVSQMPALVGYALEREQEQTAWDLWSQTYPLMVTGLAKPQSFEEFKKELFKKSVQHSDKSFEEIEEEMLAVVARYEGR